MEEQGSTSFEMFQSTVRPRVGTVDLNAMAESIVRQAVGDQRAACALLDDLQAAVNIRLQRARG